MNYFGLFAGTTISNNGSFRIVLNVFQSIKFVDDWMFKSACSGLFTVAVNEPFCTHKFFYCEQLRNNM